MINLTPKYVVDGKKRIVAAFIRISKWEKIIEEIEEPDYIIAYDEAKASIQESIPFDSEVREIREGYET